MKKFSQLNEAKSRLNIQDDTINYCEVKDLKDYLETSKKFLSPEAVYVCNWLIDNNTTYIKDFSKDGDNALADFYDEGVPSDPNLKELYKSIGILVKNNRLLEIPVFQTKDQFYSILGKSGYDKLSPDEVIIDLVSAAGRNAVAKKYTPLVHKIAKSFNGVSNYSYDELIEIGYEGLTRAMNTYGKKSEKQRKKEENGADEMDITKYKAYSFLSYAAYMIRLGILEGIKNESHLVRIPVSQQAKERKEKGHNTKNHSTSGDAAIGGGEDGNRSLFDLMGEIGDNGGRSLDMQDLDKLWNSWKEYAKETWGETMMNFVYDLFGLWGHKKQENKALCSKLGWSTAKGSGVKSKILKWAITDPKSKKLITDVYELLKECKNDIDHQTNIFDEPIRVKSNNVNENSEEE